MSAPVAEVRPVPGRAERVNARLSFFVPRSTCGTQEALPGRTYCAERSPADCAR